MGLFGFGKKRTPAEILSKGRSQYVKGNLKKALSILRSLADEGNPQACCYVGRIYLEQKDKSLAQPYLITAAKGGQSDAATLLASQFGIREYLPKEAEPAPEVSAPAAEEPAQKSAPEQEVKAPDADEEAYLKGDECMKELDWEGGIKYWTQAAKEGHAEALKKMTVFYMSGYKLGRTKYKPSREYIDYDKAIEWGSRAMKHGVDVAENLMTAYVKKGQTAEAIKLGQKAAAHGMDVEWKLMQLYLNEGSYAEAVLWGQRYDEKNKSTKASQRIEQQRTKVFDKGYAAYEKKNGKTAISYFEKSADLGSVKAMFYIGHIYDNGEGIPENKEKALYWYQKAAKLGDAKAQECLRKYSVAQGDGGNP